MTDVRGGLRLAVTTLSVVRLPTGRVDRSTARIAMLAAPLVGLALGAVAAACGYAARLLWHSSALSALTVLAVLAALTGLLHLDGLADTGDGIGAPHGRDRLAIMTNPGIGAFGVATVVFVVLAQLLAFTRAYDLRIGTLAVMTAAATSRLAVTLGCLRGVRAARSDGLGAMVAETVARGGAALVVVITAAAVVAITAVHDDSWVHVGRMLWSMAAGLVSAGLCYFVAVRRLGGITGDVLGAVVEISAAVTVLAAIARG